MTNFRTPGIGCFKLTINSKEVEMIWFPIHKRETKEKQLKQIFIERCDKFNFIRVYPNVIHLQLYFLEISLGKHLSFNPVRKRITVSLQETYYLFSKINFVLFSNLMH